eukprot:TRINITY_DN2264_c0_g1_i10.p1 TRINITY_DN2264_c0_g1~~TRINITY_DN2264_c0_g1_i10.p1  ORF type:complete len:141 (+),score=13.74 TRINITY_DN2264_c0_g1_i10:262-684(+)
MMYPLCDYFMRQYVLTHSLSSLSLFLSFSLPTLKSFGSFSILVQERKGLVSLSSLTNLKYDDDTFTFTAVKVCSCLCPTSTSIPPSLSDISLSLSFSLSPHSNPSMCGIHGLMSAVRNDHCSQQGRTAGRCHPSYDNGLS